MGEFFPAPQWEVLQPGAERKGFGLWSWSGISFLQAIPALLHCHWYVFLLKLYRWIKPLQFQGFLKLLGDGCNEIVWNEKHLAPSLIDKSMQCSATHIVPIFVQNSVVYRWDLRRREVGRWWISRDIFPDCSVAIQPIQPIQPLRSSITRRSAQDAFQGHVPRLFQVTWIY